MPRVKISEMALPSQAEGWAQAIINRLRNKRAVLPLISNAMCNDLVLSGHSALEEAYMHYAGYPLAARTLPQMAQFKSIMEKYGSDRQAICDDYLNFAKNRLCDLAEQANVRPDLLEEVNAQFDTLTFDQFCTQLGYPRFDPDAPDPLLLLAALDLPIYITTSYHGFVEAALRRAGKNPRTDFPRWHRDLERYPSAFTGDYEPTDPKYKGEPLVYHLLGSEVAPASLVLTEDDHLRFMVACSTDIGKATDRVQSRIRDALSASSLLVLGYSLSSWEFRALFWGAIVHRSQSLTSVISLQLEPSPVERSYLDSYLDLYDFKTYWGTVQEYTQTLYQVVSSG